MDEGKAGRCHGNQKNRTTDGTDDKEEELKGRGFLPALRACAGRVLPEAALHCAYVSHAEAFNHRF
jgi:hypothetical protein